MASMVVAGGDLPLVYAEPDGVWLSEAELAALPTSGDAWERLHAVADEPLSSSTSLTERDSHNTHTLAVALVAARLADDDHRARVVTALRTVMDTRPGDDLLAASRRLSSYVVAADLINLEELSPAMDGHFRDWVARMLTHNFADGSGGANTIVEVHENRPNNWGTHAGASRIAAAIYLGDEGELAKAAAVFRGYLGDRSAYDGFGFGELSWQSNPDRPVGINPAGANIDGRSVDGVLPDDQRRAGSFTWPPPQENYVWEGLQGAVFQAQLLHRQGYGAWKWQDQALKRAVTWLHDQASFPAEGDDTWVPWLVNSAYGTNFPVNGSRPGKALGFTDWTHGGLAGAPGSEPVEEATPSSEEDVEEEASPAEQEPTEPEPTEPEPTEEATPPTEETPESEPSETETDAAENDSEETPEEGPKQDPEPAKGKPEEDPEPAKGKPEKTPERKRPAGVAPAAAPDKELPPCVDEEE